MKAYLVILILLLSFTFITSGQKQSKSIKTQIINVSNLQDLNKLNLNFCDTFSTEINGLYAILKSEPLLADDSSIVKVILIKKGFTQTDWGSGNWEKGPRFIYLKYTKGDCNCSVYKKYYYNKKMKDGSYDLRISERIICNSDKFMDE
jgi:hypothetical protein